MMEAKPCSACQRRVVFAMLDGKPVAVESVPRGRGDIALTEDLLERRTPAATRVSTGTRWCLHGPRCRGLKSFTKPFRREAVR